MTASLYQYSNTRTCGSTKTYEQISAGERPIVIDITAKFAESIKEKQDRLLTLYWLQKLHK